MKIRRTLAKWLIKLASPFYVPFLHLEDWLFLTSDQWKRIETASKLREDAKIVMPASEWEQYDALVSDLALEHSELGARALLGDE